MNQFLNTPPALTGHVLNRLGCPIHYWVGGAAERPLIVLMHGATMDHRMFNAQIAPLLADYRVLVWDARGHGLSQPVGTRFTLELLAQDLLAILDELGVAQAVIGGQSMGGYVAQQVYFLAPERVRAMLIIGATPLTKAYSRLEVWTLKATMPLFGLWPYDHLIKVIGKNTATEADVQAYAIEAVRQIRKEDFLTIWRAVTLAIDHVGRPGFTFDVPLLLLHGDHDRTGTIRRDMPIWAKSEPMAVYQVIPHAGHNANQDNPTFTNQAILGFLQQTLA